MAAGRFVAAERRLMGSCTKMHLAFRHLRRSQGDCTLFGSFLFSFSFFLFLALYQVSDSWFGKQVNGGERKSGLDRAVSAFFPFSCFEIRFLGKMQYGIFYRAVEKEGYPTSCMRFGRIRQRCCRSSYLLALSVQRFRVTCLETY